MQRTSAIRISLGRKETGAIGTAEHKLADGILKARRSRVDVMGSCQRRVEPEGNAIIITKQASGSAKIDPLMAAFSACILQLVEPVE